MSLIAKLNIVSELPAKAKADPVQRRRDGLIQYLETQSALYQGVQKPITRKIYNDAGERIEIEKMPRKRFVVDNGFMYLRLLLGVNALKQGGEPMIVKIEEKKAVDTILTLIKATAGGELDKELEAAAKK